MATLTTPGGNIHFTTSNELSNPDRDLQRAINRDARDRELQTAVDSTGRRVEEVAGTLGEVQREAATATEAAQSARSEATRSADASHVASQTVKSYDPRISAIEALGGLSPESPVDGQTSSLITQSGTLTRAALHGAVGFVPGVVADGVTDNSAAIQAAVDQGGRWMMPPSEGTYVIGSTVTLDVPGTQFVAASAKMRSSHRMPALQVNASDVTLDIPHIEGAEGEPDFTSITGRFEGTTAVSAWVAVNVAPTAHRLHITRIFGRGFSTVVRMGGYDPATEAYATYQTEDVRIDDLGCDYVEFGAALRGTRRLRIGSIHGRYGNTVGAPRAPHLVYLSDGGAKHDQVVVGSGTATDSSGNPVDGQAFQFKDMSNSTIGPLIADNCSGVANIMDCHDSEFQSIKSVRDKYSASAGSLTIGAVDDSTGLRFGPIDIKLDTDATAVMTYAGEETQFESISVLAHHTTSETMTIGDVSLRGNRNDVGKVKIVNTSPTNSWTALVLFSGVGHRIMDVQAENVRVGVNGRTSDSTIHLDLNNISIHPEDGIGKVAGASSTGSASPRWYFPDTAYLTGHPRLITADDFRVGSGSSNTQLSGNATGHIWRWVGTSSWRIDGAGSAYENTGGSDRQTILETGVADIEMECNITWHSGEGLVFRRIDDANHLLVVLASNNIRLRKLQGGSLTDMETASRTHQVGRKYHIRVIAQGDTIQVFENGTSIIEHQLSTSEQELFSNAGNHGLRSSSSSARFDTFRIIEA